MRRLLAGAGRVDVTPRVGALLTGYAARTQPSCGIHDPLWACALFLDDGERQIAVITVDSVALPADLVGEVRRALEQTAGLHADQVLICAAHCHSGPSLSPTNDESTDYRSRVSKALCGAVGAAMENRREARLRCGSGFFEGIAANRRPGGGPTDPEVGVVGLEACDGAPIAVLVNYTCHATVLGADNLLITADYPGYLRRTVEQALGGNVVVLFANGAFGNINPGGYSPELSMIGRPIAHRTFADAEALGAGLGSEALRTLEKSSLAAEPTVGSRSRRIVLPLKARPDRSQAEALLMARRRALARLRQESAGGDELTAAEIDLAYAELQVSLSQELEGDATEAVAEIQALRLGDAFTVGIPGEPFVEIGLAIKRRSGRRNVHVVGLANGSVGYIPTDRAFAEGGYEPAVAEVAPGAEARIVDTTLALLDELSCC